MASGSRWIHCATSGTLRSYGAGDERPGKSGKSIGRHMRILITGNLGYVGSRLVRHLRSVLPAAELIGYDAGFFAHCLTDAETLPETQLTRQHYGDIRDLPPDLLEGVDAVVHLAAVSNDPMGSRF